MQVHVDAIAKALLLEAVINARIEQASEDKDYDSLAKHWIHALMLRRHWKLMES